MSVIHTHTYVFPFIYSKAFSNRKYDYAYEQYEKEFDVGQIKRKVVEKKFSANIVYVLYALCFYN